MKVRRRDFLKMASSAAVAATMSTDPSRGQVPSDLDAIFDYIDDNREAHLEKVRSFLQLPSISTTGEGMREGAELVQSYFEDLGFQESEIVETPRHPAVWARYDARTDKGLATYGMYDLVPVEGQDWSHPPFGAELVDLEMGRAIIARGANNTKGHLRAFLNAIEAILKVTGNLPLNLMFVVEGEEEIGSPSLEGVIRKFEGHLQNASGAFFPFASQNAKGDVEMFLGAKGITYMEIECSNENREQGPRQPSSSRFAPVFGSPAWRLIEALETMTDRQGLDVVIDGFYEGMRRDESDSRLISDLLKRYDPDLLLQEAGAAAFAPGLSKEEVLTRYVLYPTLNISGIWSGYTGPNPSTRMPANATAKIDARLVPDMDPAGIVPKVRAHLQRLDFDDINVIEVDTTRPYRVKFDAGIVQSLLRSYQAHGQEPLVWPNMAAAAPWALFNDPPLNLPFMMGGMGHGGNNHAPDEYMVVEGKGEIADLAEIEKFYARFLYDFAAA